MLHSRSRPRRFRSRSVEASYEDPYSTGSADFAERHKFREAEVIGIPGLIRVDIGAP